MKQPEVWDPAITVPPERFLINYALKKINTAWNWFTYFIGIGILYNWISQRIYLKRLPDTAKTLGLKYHPSEYIDQFGSLSGTIEGHPVNVEIERDARITIKSHCDGIIEDLDLDRNKSRTRPGEGCIDFTTVNVMFNFIFRTRRADSKTAQAVLSAPELLDHFVVFYNKWMKRIPWFYMRRGTLTCVLNYGYPFNPYVPDDVLKVLLADMAGLMTHFDCVIKREFHDVH